MESVIDKTDFFNGWAASYDWLIPSVFYQAVHQRLFSYGQWPDRATVLDVGCGTGKLLNRLATVRPDITGFGIDFSPEMLEQARRKNSHGDRLQFVLGNVKALPFEANQFTGVFCVMSFLHYPEPVLALREMARVLAPQGTLYLADVSPPLWATADTITQGVTPHGVHFYTAQAREALGSSAGLRGDRHDYLLGPVLLTRFTREP